MIIECPLCHIHYDVGDTLPAEGMNVRCAECHQVWLARPAGSVIETPALQSNETTTDSSHDITGRTEIITTENDDAEAGKRDLPSFPSNKFDSKEIVVENNDIHRDHLFNEVHDVISSGDANAPSDMDRQFEPAIQSGLSNGSLSSGSISTNGHNLNPDRSDPTSVGNEIARAIGGISTGAIEAPASKPRRFGIALFSWTTVLAAIAGLGLSAYMMPNRVARNFPVTAGLYHALGINVNSRGLVIQDGNYRHTNDAGRPALLVNGSVRNITDETMKVPTVITELIDKDGLILFIWATEVDENSLAPKKTTAFRAIIPAPTNLVRQVKLRFSTRP